MSARKAYKHASFFFHEKREKEEKQQNSIFLLYSQPRAPVSPNSHSKQYQALPVSVLFIEFSAWVLLYICVHAECFPCSYCMDMNDGVQVLVWSLRDGKDSGVRQSGEPRGDGWKN